MGNVHFNIIDGSNNEEYFKIYRSDDGGAAVIDPAKEVATLTWNGTAWTIANGPLATDAQIEPGSDPNDPSNLAQVFKFSYTEANPGVYNFGVVAGNFVGESAMQTTANTLTV